MRVYNFSAGPSMLPAEVLEEAQRELLDFAGTGMSVTEISHRDKAYSAVVEEAERNLRDLLNIPEDYCVIFVQGGASQQFAAVPLNLMHKGKADYLVTGNFAKRRGRKARSTARRASRPLPKIKFTHISPISTKWNSTTTRTTCTLPPTTPFAARALRNFPKPRRPSPAI